MVLLRREKTDNLTEMFKNGGSYLPSKSGKNPKVLKANGHVL